MRIWWVEASDAAKHPAMHGTAPTVQKLQPRMSVVLRLRNPEELLTTWQGYSAFKAELDFKFLNIYCSIHDFLNVINTPCMSAYSVFNYVEREGAISWLSLKRDSSNRNIKDLISLCEKVPAVNHVAELD